MAKVKVRSINMTKAKEAKKLKTLYEPITNRLELASAMNEIVRLKSLISFIERRIKEFNDENQEI